MVDPELAGLAIRRSAIRATRRSTVASRRSSSSRPGRWILTITDSPLWRTARWAWPIDADASGSKPKEANTSSTG